MEVQSTISKFRTIRPSLKGKVAFVPTMGALHEGHYSLIERAASLADHVVVSIFVNPTQFGPSEDLDRYPRSPENDLAGCESRGVSQVFMPSPQEMYPPGEYRVSMDFPEITASLEGEGRPGHFQGVLEVCSKLFHIVEPDVACFGQKDYQQLLLIKMMVKALNMNLSIEACPIVRESDGLAMSSRNRLLSDSARQSALILSSTLHETCAQLRSSPQEYQALEMQMQSKIREAADELAYAVIRDAVTLKEWVPDQGGEAVLLATARFGGVRLLDNVLLSQ